MSRGSPVLAAPLVLAAALLVSGCSSEDAGGGGACGGASDEAPSDLACTGLYTDSATRTVAPSARAYAPSVSFWSDGYEKDRWLSLPEGTTIDATSVDDWKFPVGTKVWKEFRKGQRKIETRYFWKVKDAQWISTAYVWSEDGRSARRGEGTDLTVDGAPYHVPRNGECNECHRGRTDRLLGVEAISLGQPGAVGLTLAALVAEGRISPPPPQTSVVVVEPALAILHVNCGITCHNATPTAVAQDTGLRLRLGFEEVASRPPGEWEAFRTSVGASTRTYGFEGLRIAPGDPDASALVLAMKTRGGGQMPPLATDRVDEASVAVVESWVRGLR